MKWKLKKICGYSMLMLFFIGAFAFIAVQIGILHSIYLGLIVGILYLFAMAAISLIID